VRGLLSIPVALILAAAIHVDWHLARSHDHGELSGGLTLHWLIAIPVFALAAWHISRRFVRAGMASIVTIGVAVVLGQILEPLGEYVFLQDPLSEVFAAPRVMAFLAFLAVGLVTYALVFTTLRRSSATKPS
jgi:hypothetical protein